MLYKINIKDPMRLTPIHIARDGLSFPKTCKARLTARPHTFLDNVRPSLAIYIGIRHIGCRIFTMYFLTILYFFLVLNLMCHFPCFWQYT